MQADDDSSAAAARTAALSKAPIASAAGLPCARPASRNRLSRRPATSRRTARSNANLSTGRSDMPRPARAILASKFDPAFDQPVRHAPATRLDADEEAGNRPDARIGGVGGIDWRRPPALVVPLGHVGARADLHPADRLAILERQHARWRPGPDPRLDVVLVTFPVAGAARCRRQPEMCAPAAVAGTLLTEKIFKIRPKLGHQRRYGRIHELSPGPPPCRGVRPDVPLLLFSLCSQRWRFLSTIPITVFAATA